MLGICNGETSLAAFLAAGGSVSSAIRRLAANGVSLPGGGGIPARSVSPY